MRILVIGSGGREHAMVRALLASPSSESVACAPGSDAIGTLCPVIDIFTHTDILRYCKAEKIELVVIGPEQPLVMGLADFLEAEGIAVFGPNEAGAQLEASKAFTKKLCDEQHIPTAAYATFDALDPAIAYVKKLGAPIVIKADGLAAGKGVTVAETEHEAIMALTDCFEGAFGEAGSRVVIEECLEGEEVSFFALCDGQTATLFASAQDHKRAFDHDLGPNTGGMGSFSPTPLMTPELNEIVMRTIIAPTMRGLAEGLIRYKGVLFAGLMLTKSGPKLIEYNCRFGDPETQSILARFEGDFAALLMSCAQGAIRPDLIRLRDDAAITVVMAASGYPGKYVRGTAIGNLEVAANCKNVTLLHAGTRLVGDQWQSNGGRVLNVVATGPSLRLARMSAYEAVDCVQWEDGFCRRDIAAKILK